MKPFLLSLLLLTSVVGKSQMITDNSINALSGSFSNENISVELYVGELIIEELSTSTITLSHGQADITILSNVLTEIDSFIDQISVFPNPTSRNISIQTSQINQKISAELYDNQGKKIFETEIGSQTSTVDLSNYSKGLYYLKILSDGISVQSFKIIKE